ncbi:MAG TPA: hypothetical protein ENF34_03890 [Candidatus Bathyarchaeota archaeon]|nr:hypothetical protein [Candidatus Bathyarchaeota archaeon]
MELDLSTILLIASIAAGFGICFALGWRARRRDPAVEKVVDAIVENYLDERKFSVGRLVKDTGLDRDRVRRALRRLERAGVVTHVGDGNYRLKDPLVFLTEPDYARAVRITKDDNILYGAYQNPYLPRLYLLCVYGLFLADLVFAVLTYLSYTIGWPTPLLSQWVLGILPSGKAEELLVPFLLFLVGMGMIFVDFLDNIIKGWARERYMVIVGALSGVSYDTSLADELSGRIRRGRIVDVDLDVSLLQKLINYFRSVPLGDVKVRYRIGKEEKVIAFRNMPFPRELYYVIRSVQLGALGWRKKYARTLMLWRARAALPSVRG